MNMLHKTNIIRSNILKLREDHIYIYISTVSMIIIFAYTNI